MHKLFIIVFVPCPVGGESIEQLSWDNDRSVLELAGTVSIRHKGSFSQLLTEATPVALLL